MQNYEKNDFKQEWMENLSLFAREMDSPREVAASLAQSLEQVFKNREVLHILTAADRTYSENIHMDYEKILEELKDVSPRCGIHTYTLHMLFYIILSRKTRKIYEERGIAPEIFRASMMDLHWKLLECRKMFGIWGTSVAQWQIWWFEVRRFALGRFQYELVPFRETYEKDGVSLHPGDLVINVHIPSCGPLKREEYMKSYAMAVIPSRTGPLCSCANPGCSFRNTGCSFRRLPIFWDLCRIMTFSERSITTGICGESFMRTTKNRLTSFLVTQDSRELTAPG